MRGLLRRENGMAIRLVPDVLLPIQFGPRDAVLPERALVASVLLDGVECFLRHHGTTDERRRRLFDEAEQWLFGEDDGSPFSFEEACDFLALDPACLRSELRQWCTDRPPR